MNERNHIEAMLDRLTSRQVAKIDQAVDALEANRISEQEFTSIVTTVLLVGNAKGYALGAALARSLIEAKVGRVQVTPTESGAHLDVDRLAGALATVLATDGDLRMRLKRLATNEPQQAAADGQQDVIFESVWVDGYERDVESSACDLCLWWAAESHKFKSTARFPRHPECRCSMIPVVKETSDA